MSVHFEPVWSWMLTLLASAAMLTVILVTYPRRVRHLPAEWRRLLISLRLLLWLLLTLLLFRPVAVFESSDQSRSILYVLSDASPSMQTEDATGGGTRRQALIRTLEEADSSLATILKKSEIRYRDFSDSLQAAEKPVDVTAGSMTAIGKILEQAAAEIGRSRVPAVILLSDGKQVASGSLDVDPISLARQFGRQQRPVYAIGFGSTEAIGSALDLALDDLDVSREVFQGNVLPIRVRLQAAGAQGQNVTVRVLLENRAGLQDGQSGPMETVPASEETRPVVSLLPSTSSEEQILQLQIAPQQVGDLKLAIEAEPLSGEVRKTNNRVETIIRVRRGGIRVAYFDIARPEQKWLRRINDSSRIQLDFHLIRTGSLLRQNAIPDRYFQPGNYDGFMIGDVPATAFSARQLDDLRRCVNQGSGLMMTGGYQNFGQGGYAQTPLAPLLPVELPAENQQLTQPQKMAPARDGLSHYILQIAAPEQNRTRWEQLPPLVGGTVLTPRNNSLAQVLATSDHGFPLLVGHTIGPSRILAFAGDTTWQWPMYGFSEEHLRFWRQTIFWLTRKEIDDEQPVWILATPRDLTPGQPTELSFGARDAQGNPVLDAAFEVEVTDPEGKRIPLTPRDGGQMSLADFEETLLPGDYWARVKASRNGEALAGIAVTRFSVNARDPELDDPTADYALLREISLASGGEFLTREQFLERLQRWAEEGLPGLSLMRQEQLSLWDNWFVLLLTVALLASEWAVRKKRGLV